MANSKTLLKQRLFKGHEFIGMLTSFFLYISLFFGIFAIFLPYIQIWENPSLYFAQKDIATIHYEKMLNPILKEQNQSNSKLELTLVGFRNQPYLTISRPFSKPYHFNPHTFESITLENSNLANFLNEIHYAKPLGLIALTLYGLISTAIIFVIIGGLTMVILYRFGKHSTNRRRFLSKWHRNIFIWLSLPFFLFILCAAVMGISFSGLAPLSYFATKGEQKEVGAIIGKVLFPRDEIVKKTNINTKMLPINILIKKAQSINPNINYEKATLIHWGEKNARIILEGYNPYKPFLNGITNKPKVTLKGSDGALISQIKVEDRKYTILIFEAVYFLHLLFGVDIFSRVIVALMMFACGVGLVFSIMLYLSKRVKVFKSIPTYHWLEKLSIFVVVGIFLATASLFLTQWLLPFNLENRLIWQQGIFYNVWIATLTYSFYEKSSKKAIKRLFTLSGACFILSVLCHQVSVGLQVKILDVILVDMALFVLGVSLLYLGYKLNKKDLHV